MSLIHNPCTLTRHFPSIPRFNFVQAPHQADLVRILADGDPLFLRVTTRSHKKDSEIINAPLCISPSSRSRMFSNYRIVQGRVMYIVSDDAFWGYSPVGTPRTWPVEDSEIELVFNPNTKNRSGFFITRGEHTFFQ
jgi:hypothetical protein